MTALTTIMTWARNLSALGAFAAGAAVLGVHLGESAIAEINPTYFQGPALHPRERGAAIAEPMPNQQVRFSSLYGWAEGQEARRLDCHDCAALAARDAYADAEASYSAYEPEPVYRQASWRPERPPMEQPEVEAPAQADTAPWRAAVSRYAAYQISADDASAVVEEVEPAEQAEPEELAAYEE